MEFDLRVEPYSVFMFNNEETARIVRIGLVTIRLPASASHMNLESTSNSEAEITMHSRYRAKL